MLKKFKASKRKSFKEGFSNPAIFFAIGLAAMVVLAGITFLFLKNSSKTLMLEKDIVSNESITIGVAALPLDLKPTQFNPLSRSLFINTLEGLVRTDEHLSIQSGLAVAWGRIDDTTWEFTLRPKVYFHDGTLLKPEDVVTSIERAQKNTDSELRNLLASIKEVIIADDLHLRIITKVPDPLLLQKLVVTPITPAIVPDGKIIGTGPYFFSSINQDSIVLERFDKYWNKPSYFKTVIFQQLPSIGQRIQALEQGTVDLLMAVPPTVACSLTEKYSRIPGCIGVKNPEISMVSIPGLQVDFLVFNQKNEILASKEVRKAILKTFDPAVFQNMSYGFTTPASQFVSNGVFGYNPELPLQNYDIDQAKSLMEKALKNNFEQPSITFDYPQELQGLGEYVKGQLLLLGVNIQLNPLSSLKLQQKIESGESDFYFLGWRSELGDAADFLSAVAHSRSTRQGYGKFNGNNYSNKKVDAFIEQGLREFDPARRLELFQQAMLLLQSDAMGVPLYQSENIFAFKKDIQFKPRIDGYVLVADLKK